MMKKRNALKATVLALAALAMGVSMASATLVFQSVAVDLSNISPASAVAGSSNSDNTWYKRTGFGETGATILEGWDATENVPVLTQTLSGLLAGTTYDIYVNYVRFGAGADPDGNRGGARGSLNGSTFTLFNGTTGTAGTVGFSELTGFSNSDRVGLRGYLGTAMANGAGEILVYVDDDGLDGAIEERVWFDGASYEAISFIDTDNDGMPDSWETDNDLVVGVDDSALDEDDDGGPDGLTNIQEFQRGTDPQDSDTDDDGLKDGVETDTGTYVSPANTGTNPLVADTDDDGLLDGVETDTGTYVSPADRGTDPFDSDTDGDTFTDGYEVDKGSDPLDPSSVPPPPPGVVEVAPDGIWTWFNDERAIFHNGYLYSGYVRNDGYAGVTRYDPASSTAIHMQLGTAASKGTDDHNNPSLTILADGRLLASYSRHSADNHFFTRTSSVTNPASDSDWNAEQTVSTNEENSYVNTYRLSAESDEIYIFHRDINWNPTISRSSDNGATWDSPVHFINRSDRPYPRYCSNHSNRVDAIYTDGHPRTTANSIYHLYYQGGNFYKTDGTLLKSFANLPLNHDSGERGTVVYPYSSASWGAGEGPDDWIPSGRAWTWDIHYGSDGHPVCTFQVQRDDVTGSGWNHDRIYYYYARWTGTEWQRRFIAQGGRGFYSAEPDYGGGISIDPDDTRIIYISSNAANPFDLSSLDTVPLGSNERYEIWRGFTADGGLTFTWEPVTQNSTANNMRPIVPENHGRTRHVLWFNGTYSTYTSFSTKVLGVFDDAKEEFTAWQAGFGIAGAALDDDSDGDGLVDLLEYALGGDPTDPLNHPFPTISSDRFSFHHLPPRTDVEWIVETTPDLLGAWTEIATVRAAGLPNDIAAGYALGTDGGDPALLTIEPDTESPQGFYRLKVRYGN